METPTATAPKTRRKASRPATFDPMATRLDALRLCVRVDESPDLSWLGDYSSQPGLSDRTVDRHATRADPRTLRYFIAANGPEETGNPESVAQDFKRMEDYNRQVWCMLGIWAEVDAYVAGVRQTFRSGGLWGIESDGPDDYREQVAREQVADLRQVLAGLGLTDLLPAGSTFETKPGNFPRLSVVA